MACDTLMLEGFFKAIDHFALYDKSIDEYVARGRLPDAISLLALYGELMMSETVSFRERQDFTMPKYRERLLRLLRLAGSERVALLSAQA